MEKQTNEKRIEGLNNLVRINNDRFEGYSQASKETIDEDLNLLFFDFAHKSKDYALLLSKYVHSLGGEPAINTTAGGKAYRLWMDIRAAFLSKDRKAILASCEFGEDAALKAYNEFIENDELHMDSSMMDTIFAQKSELQMAHDKVKALRDEVKIKNKSI